MNKKPLLVAFLLVSAACFVFAGGQKEKEAEKPQAEPKETIQSGTGTSLTAINPEKIAQINDASITMDELNAEVERYEIQYKNQGQTLDETKMKRLRISVLQTLINQKLILMEFEKSGLSYDTAAVDKEVDSIRAQFNSDDEYLQSIGSQGYSPETIREAITEQVKIQTMVNDIVKDVKLNENEAREYYDNNPDDFKTPEMVRAAHILIKTENTFTDAQKAEALEKIKAIKKELDNGADFAETAKAKSEGPSNVKGGDLGFFAKEQMVKPFSDAAWALKKNEVSDVVETQFGYHLIKKLDHKDASIVPFEDAFPKLTQQLLQYKQQKAFESYLLTLREKSSIEIFLPELRME